MNKKTAFLFVIIIIALSVAVYFLYTSLNNPLIGSTNPTVTSITYKNTDYGFTFSLPATWQGYSIVKDTWKGTILKNTTAQNGPKILIRNPKWTASSPYEDLPVLVFTIPQWDAYLKEDFSISAAPIKATELGRNNVYVFALPPRWDYDYSLDYQEAQTIIAGNPLHPFNTTTPTENTGKSEAINPKNATYIINGQPVTLVNGVSIVPVTPGSSSMVTTRYFGNEATHDFDGDGRLDIAFILTQNTGGSGTFYYVVIALNMARGYTGSAGFLLGDRISPQTTEMSKDPSTPNTIIVNYAVRKQGESFTVQPSVGKSVWLKLDIKTMQFGEVAQNFEGEVDPSKMTLTMQKWNWVRTTYNNDTTVAPKTAKKFTITFNGDKTFSASTDCNGIGGEYIVNGKKITLTKMMSTLMYCEGSQERDFSKILGEVQSYMFTTKGELILLLSYDSGSMIFK